MVTQLSSLVEDLHTERLFILVLMVIDVDQDLFLSDAAAWHEPQADGVGLSSCHLQEHGDFSFAWASTLLQKPLELYNKQAHG